VTQSLAAGISDSKQLVSLDRARWRLAAVWFPACGVVFLLLIGQSIGGVFGDEIQRVWGWALPNFVPTLALMISVFAAEAVKPHAKDTSFVRKNFYLLALGLSVFYLGLLLFSILIQPFLHWINGAAGGGIAARMDLLETSNLWLGPLQGLVVGSLSVLFFLQKEQKS
jgi:hypothetical protein